MSAQLEASSALFDVIVIGGGIIGCGIARDASLRGLKVALFEREDYGYGTSSRSTRLIHGGLRYLEMFDFGLVRQDLREREILLHLAPHRVKPLPFLLPFYNRSALYRSKLRVGMLLYDLLSFDKSLPNHKILSREEVIDLEPGLNPNGLQGGLLYYDAQVALPERLCLENILDAQRNDAQTFNHSEVTSLLRDSDNRVCGVEVQDRLTQQKSQHRAKLVINATGVWLDRLTQNWTPTPPARLRLTKGIHFASPNATKNALVLFSEQDGRLLFVIPWLEYAWVGTTDTDFNADLDTVHATHSEVAYLQATAQQAIPNADWKTIHFTNAGVRALVRDIRLDASESGVSRKHGLVIHPPNEDLHGVLSVLGGKLTAYRDIARETVDTALSILQPNSPPLNCTTHRAPLSGAETANWEQFCLDFVRHPLVSQLDTEQRGNLLMLYGTRALRLLERCEQRPTERQRFHASYPDIHAQLHFAIEEEQAQTLTDFLLRRTRLGFTRDQGLQALETIATIMGTKLGWNAERKQNEIAHYRNLVDLTQKFRTP